LAGALPHGDLLSAKAWARRHRLITWFALAQSAGLAGFALAGRPPAVSLGAVFVAAAPAAIGLLGAAPRRLRTSSVVASLMFASIAVVALSGGAAEANFAFFVALGVVALYQDWSAFGLALGLVAARGVVGVVTTDLAPAAGLEREHPVRWALVFGGFVLAAGITHVVTWKLNEQQNLRDQLTRLPNRQLFVQRLFALLRGSDEPVSVLYVDLDDFKTINDAHGHRVGDLALYQAGQVMAEAAGGRDPVARIGGDEFAIVQRGTAAQARQLAERIIAALGAPLTVEGREILVSVSVGVADTVVAESRNAEALVRDADLAMHMAKCSGKSRVVSYASGVDRAVVDRAELRQDLRLALDLDQLEIHYQPTFRFRDGRPRLCGVEALVRWRHPQRGLVSPVEFIPLAEESGDIKAIGAWVLRTAVRQVAQWQRELPGCGELEVAVNLSPGQLRDPELLTFIGAALHESGLTSGCLILEVTETMLLSDLHRAQRQLDVVRQMGARVAIDDFGTGYSSLSYLARLPADQVKIDRSFVQDIVVDATSVALVRSIVELAAALGLDVQAEGVEEPEQQRILTELGCPRSQGFLYSRPLAAAEFVRFAATAPIAETVPEAGPPSPDALVR
jgi:diguanylate cyclase (GGDEF)-like protein